ncbi:MAG: HAMP domain-containing histidine kinase [Oscillospiraceae bacterium]|nr:HAMP domain-containing histidine kinase [Oscillospiraceae bacterium]
MEKIKTKFNSLGIKYKIFLYLISFCALLLLLLWVFQVVLMDKIYENVRVSHLYKAFSQIESVIVDNGNLDDIDDIAQENDTCVMVIRPNGFMVYSSDVSRNCRVHKMSYVEIVEIIMETQNAGGELKGMYTRKNPFIPGRQPDNSEINDGRKSLMYVREMKNGDKVQAYIILDAYLSPVSATVSAIQRQLQFITIILVVFSALIATIMARKIAKPIEKVTRDAQQLATGDYDTVFNASGYAEINQLSSTLTHTAEELGKVEKQRKDFIANVSHDLRTPLTLIGGYAEIMRDIPGENNAENAQMIIDETARLSTLVNDLLDMSRIQSGAIPMEKVRYNLTESLRRTVNRMNNLLKQDGYNIDFSADFDVYTTADEVRISQCFYNILINAINYTGADKKIYVYQQRDIGSVKISVTDTGDGVAEEDIPYVWERYYKNKSNHKRSVTGTGLGLSIVKSVIKEHGGHYGVYNTEEKGACFWFSLPVNN